MAQQATVAQLIDLSNRLKSAQRAIIDTAALSGAMPTETSLRKISDLEGAIAAVDVLIQEASDGR
ncbi:hypothetical protein [Chthonobacter rhizosphaerae]|uniref:hypothetical protein n=1 Tax=Chthonobacter rhizosphaerae TaxID=2735553 RepID=UPI0015EF646A|nr:hypothetical protein [Chthonobacter rhizosphaerae]